MLRLWLFFASFCCLPLIPALAYPWTMSGRDWRRVNDGLVRRGELLLDLDFVKGWGEELDSMNSGKEGAKYRYPGQLHPPRSSSCTPTSTSPTASSKASLGLSKYVEGLRPPDYSTIQWRAGRLHLHLDQRLVESGEDLVIALDATGIKVANRGEWIRRRWGARRGYLKVHIAVDVKRKRIVALEVTDERTGDGRMLKPLVEGASTKGRGTRVLADGAYDSKQNFHYLVGEGDRARDKGEMGQLRKVWWLRAP